MGQHLALLVSSDQFVMNAKELGDMEDEQESLLEDKDGDHHGDLIKLGYLEDLPLLPPAYAETDMIADEDHHQHIKRHSRLAKIRLREQQEAEQKEVANSSAGIKR